MLWFIAQYLFNVSLSLTSVTSNTILSSTSSLFTFALSMLVLKEPYSLAKLLSIAACIGGKQQGPTAAAATAAVGVRASSSSSSSRNNKNCQRAAGSPAAVCSRWLLLLLGS
jgi:hypothetical protein